MVTSGPKNKTWYVLTPRSFPNISVPALELHSRAAPIVGGYHHRSVVPTTGINPGGRQKKNVEN